MTVIFENEFLAYVVGIMGQLPKLDSKLVIKLLIKLFPTFL